MNNFNNEIKNILNKINKNDLIDTNNNLKLTYNQIEILKKYSIEYETATSIRDLMIKIEEVLDYEDIDELELILEKLSERQYYENTNK